MRRLFVALSLIFIFAYILRIIFLPQLALSFHYDMARDAYIVKEILNGDLKILGPPTSISGLYHGVFYYYLLAPAYWLGSGSPVAASYWIALLNAATIFIVFYLAYLLTKNFFPAVLSAAVFALSFESTQYATWLSNPTIALWSVPLVYIGLFLWLKGRVWGPVLTAFGLGISIQANLFLLYHIIPISLWLLIYRKEISPRALIKFVLVLFLTTFTIFLSEVKFGFQGLAATQSLFLREDPFLAEKSFSFLAGAYFEQLGKVFTGSILPSFYESIAVGRILILVVFGWLFYEWRTSRNNGWQLLLASYLLSHFPAIFFGGTTTPHIAAGLGAAVAVVLGIIIWRLWQKSKILGASVLLIVLVANLSVVLKENVRGQTLFTVQDDMILRNELAALDYTYREADGQPFSINSVTNPLWINTTWTYLYKWYGADRYGYVPGWHGRDQVGQLDTLPRVEKGQELTFLIREPLQGIGIEFLEETVRWEDANSQLLEKKYFGEIEVQKRLKHPKEEYETF